MKNRVDYSLYKCPYSHLKKNCRHELYGPEGYEDAYGIWCACGFRGPVFYLDPEELKLEKKDNTAVHSDVAYATSSCEKCTGIKVESYYDE